MKVSSITIISKKKKESYNIRKVIKTICKAEVFLKWRLLRRWRPYRRRRFCNSSQKSFTTRSFHSTSWSKVIYSRVLTTKPFNLYLLFTYRIVAGSNARYSFKNKFFDKRSQYVSIKNSLHKQSEKACMCFKTRRVRSRHFTI